jgi:hypothetical protein
MQIGENFAKSPKNPNDSAVSTDRSDSAGLLAVTVREKCFSWPAAVKCCESAADQKGNN